MCSEAPEFGFGFRDAPAYIPPTSNSSNRQSVSSRDGQNALWSKRTDDLDFVLDAGVQLATVVAALFVWYDMAFVPFFGASSCLSELTVLLSHVFLSLMLVSYLYPSAHVQPPSSSGLSSTPMRWRALYDANMAWS